MVPINDNNRKWWILAAMGGVIGLILLDETVVGVALPTIRTDLGMSQVAAHWVVNAYLLVFAGLAAAAGRLGDLAGLHRLFTAGVAIFGIGSLACGFAESGDWLIAARAVQGVGAAVIFPCSLSMVTIAFPADQRGLALGLSGSIGTVFLALGPLIGGFFTDVVSWRWIFWINPLLVIPVALIIWAAWVDVPRQGAPESMDHRGLVALLAGLGMLVFSVMQGPDWGWSHAAIWIPFVGGIASLVTFVLIERPQRAPLIEVDLFRGGTFTACNLILFVAQFSKIALIVFGALYLQDVLAMSPLAAGVALLAAVAPIPFVAPYAGRAADRYGARGPSLCGMFFTTLAIIWIGLAVDARSYALLLPALLLYGVSQAFLFPPSQHAIMTSVPREKQGEAGGIAMTAQLLGGTIGMSICSTVFAVTGDFRAVFLTTGAIMLTVLGFGWFAIRSPARDRVPDKPAY